MPRVVELAEKAGEFVTDVSGFVVYWPTPTRGGAYSANDLRALADELDRRNAPYEAQLAEYFEHGGKVDQDSSN